MKSLGSFWKNIFNFKDRTNNKTFWINFLFYYAVVITIYCIGEFVIKDIPGIVEVIFSLLALIWFIGTASLSVRRLHDADKSVLLLLFIFWPVIGHIVLFCMLIQDSATESKYIDRPYV